MSPTVRRARTPAPVSAADHNAVMAKATARAERLEERLADVVRPILEQAGREAATAFAAKATDFLTAAGPDISAASTMIALMPRPEEAQRLAVSAAVPPETLHVTLAFLGDVEGDLAAVADALRPVAASHAPLSGEVAGMGYFGPGGGGPVILLPDAPGLVEMRVDATEALVAAGVDYSRDHGYQAHMTLFYRGPDEEEIGEDYEPVGEPLHFDSILVVRADVVEYELPLVGPPPLTASATASRERRPRLTAAAQPPWSAPAGDEILDVDALVGRIKAKTDPVRNALLEQTMTPSLRQAGLTFDVTNPLTEKILAGSASQITHIAQTTQLNVMRTIRASYNAGLSIPQTAEAIRTGMAAAAGPRATLIARTELAGVVNGGSLAATRIVSDATGAGYVKTWLTAPGAPHPRHELYDGLDGQKQDLDQPFEVGGSTLQFPGDPDGPPEEVCNCRCTLVYDTPEGQEEASADEPPDLSSAEGGDAGGLGFGSLGGVPASAPAAPTALVPADVLSIQGGTRGALVPLRQAIESSMTDVGKLVGLPDRSNLPADGLRLTMRKNQTSRGHIKYQSAGGRAKPIEINISSAQHPAITFAHEYGHLLDLSYLGDTPGVFQMQNIATATGDLRAALEQLDEAWKASGSYKALDALPAGDRAARYYKSRKELWARSFSQWAAERAGPGSVLHDELQAEIAQEGRVIDSARRAATDGLSFPRFYLEFWQPGDFDAISAALERVLRASGLLRG